MSHVLVLLLGLAIGALAVVAPLRWRRRRQRLAPSPKRIVFPFAGRALSAPALDAALRLAQAEHATLVPVFLATVPRHLPLDAPLPRQAAAAMPLLEAIELRASRNNVVADSRIERGRTLRHAMREVMVHEHCERIVVPAARSGEDGFSAADIAWLLEHADEEVVVLQAGRAAQPQAPPV